MDDKHIEINQICNVRSGYIPPMVKWSFDIIEPEMPQVFRLEPTYYETESFIPITIMSENLPSRNQCCNQCGSCCKAVYLGTSFKEIKEMAKDKANTDAKFIVKNWVPINEGTAKRINPNYFKRINSPDHKEKKKSLGILEFYYICKKYDHKTKKCLVHGFKSKPRVCCEYPFYTEADKAKLKSIPYSEDCGYWENQKDV